MALKGFLSVFFLLSKCRRDSGTDAYAAGIQRDCRLFAVNIEDVHKYSACSAKLTGKLILTDRNRIV